MSASEHERLEKANAAVRELEAKRVARAQAREREAEIRRRELEAEYAAAVLDAEDAHGPLGQRIRRVDATYPDGTLLGIVIVRAADVPRWRAYENTIGDAKGTNRDQIVERLWRPCRVWPSEETVDAYIEKQPFLRARIVEAIQDLAGLRAKEDEGKS